MKFLLFTLFTTSLYANSIIVYKSERRLDLIDNNGQLIKQYKVMLGLNPIGAKSEEGDNKTPEGKYELDQINPKSKYHFAFHISYPNSKQKLHAKLRGKRPGGDIMLHGFPNEMTEIDYFLRPLNLSDLASEQIIPMLPLYDWTNGCIAVKNEEIDEIAKYITIPTSITINP